jgi:hypothetical protein
VRDARVARRGVGEQQQACGVQVAVGREHPRLDRDLGVEALLLEAGDDEAEAARQGAGLRAIRLSGVTSALSIVALRWRRILLRESIATGAPRAAVAALTHTGRR